MHTACLAAMLFKTLIWLLLVFAHAQNDYEQLPNCLERYVPGLVLVSTIDGKFSALNAKGELQWQIETEPGPLLASNIHSLELTSSGKWIRIIPSLTGSLYRFDGATIDPLSISAESLLRSSFKYSDDLIIAGGLDVRTYGVGFRTGHIFYTCSSLNCINNTNSGNEVDDILLIERSTQTVRAVEAQSGHESVGHHDIKLPRITCIDPNSSFNYNITAKIPDGLLLASNFPDNETTWNYHFTSPIVRVWKWNGYKLSEVDLFQVKDTDSVSSSLYLYIHESSVWTRKLQDRPAIGEVNSLGKIPWKPVSASGLLTEEDSTAISVLYNSEYVNGHGYYLYSETDVKQKYSGLCENNNTKIPDMTSDAGSFNPGYYLWWKELVVIIFTTVVICNFMFRSIVRRHNRNKEVIFVERHIEVPSQRSSESSDDFSSRFLHDFDTLQCLGKGGFGVVFEVKQKIDECHYAIKRIILPNEESKREGVMREVKALAKLEHNNIVRYFNSWVEKPPLGWQQQHDSNYYSEESEYPTETSTNVSRRTVNDGLHTNASGSSIVFETNSNELSKISCQPNDITDTMSGDSRQISGVDWRRPSRRYHCINDMSQPINCPAFLYIQMQLCQKQSLKEWLVDNKGRDFTDVLTIFKQIVSAVEYVHLQGLIHRDLKPSNIFFSMDGQIKVGDFGLVKDEEESYEVSNGGNPLRGHTKEVGTSLYMSPEQQNGKKYNYKVDIYSLGLIFFELLVHFSTEMERIQTISSLRKYRYPDDFVQKRTDEYNLLSMMLCESPERRLTTFGIRARPPLNCCDNYDETYDFELPKSIRSSKM